ncbi:Hypothetical predicted protein, partial [Prunus dulcis]
LISDRERTMPQSSYNNNQNNLTMHKKAYREINSRPPDDGTHVWTRVAGTPGYYLSNMLNEKSDVYSFGIVLLEIITSRPALSKTHEKIHIGQWVSFMVEKGDIRSIVDSRLKGNFNTNSAWKAVEVALACVSSSSTKRPTMSQVVTELKECLAAELARNKEIRDTDSNDSNELMSLKFTTEMRPLARQLKMFPHQSGYCLRQSQHARARQNQPRRCHPWDGGSAHRMVALAMPSNSQTSELRTPTRSSMTRYRKLADEALEKMMVAAKLRWRPSRSPCVTANTSKLAALRSVCTNPEKRCSPPPEKWPTRRRTFPPELPRAVEAAALLIGSRRRHHDQETRVFRFAGEPSLVVARPATELHAWVRTVLQNSPIADFQTQRYVLSLSFIYFLI